MRPTLDAGGLETGLRSLPARIKGHLRPETTRLVVGTVNRLKANVRSSVEASGLGRNMARTWRSATFPASGEAITPAAVLYSKFPTVMRAFEEGATIAAKGGKYLAIPTPEAIALVGGNKRDAGSGKFRSRRVTPREFEARSGIDLAYVEASGARFLIARGVGGKGSVRGTRFRTRNAKEAKRGKGEREFVAFWLVRAVSLRKRFDLDAMVSAAGAELVAGLPAAIERAARRVASGAAVPAPISGVGGTDT